jgi:hypothetical protein
MIPSDAAGRRRTPPPALTGAIDTNAAGARKEGAMNDDSPWFYGLVREGGCYRIAASGPTEARVRRALADVSVPTLVVMRDELSALGVPDSEVRRWLPDAIERPQQAGER